MVARRGRSTPPRELVRLTPIQFSLSVAIVVFIAAGFFLFGYRMGFNRASLPDRVVTDAEVIDSEGKGGGISVKSSEMTTVTFYNELTEPLSGIKTKTSSSTDDVVTVDKIESTGLERAPTVRQKPERSDFSEVFQPSGSIFVQIASYTQREKASQLLLSLHKEGYSGSVVKVTLGERGVWYRVRLGPVVSDSEAERVLLKLRNERSLKGYIVR